MTEAEWLVCNDPQTMLEFVRNKATQRQLRLFLCACCRGVWDWLKWEESRHAVETAERYADGLATKWELHTAWGQADNVCLATDHAVQQAQQECLHAEYDVDAGTDEAPQTLAQALNRARLLDRAAGLVMAATFDPPDTSHLPLVVEDSGSEHSWRSQCLQDIFGNPYRPTSVDPAWLTWSEGAVPKIARTIYEERRFEDMPILGDALEDAGCANADLLNHCRASGPHVLGCWALDLILSEQKGHAQHSPVRGDIRSSCKTGDGMTEAQYLASTEPAAMLDFLRGRASDRKLRLFMVACCRRVWNLLEHDQSRRAVEVAERFADGEVSIEELRLAADAAYDAHGSAYAARAVDAAAFAAAHASVIDLGIHPRHTARYAAYAVAVATSVDREEDIPWADEGRLDRATTLERRHQLGLLDDIFGNPFRSVTLAPAWLTPEVVGLAQAIYDERSFHRLPALASALEEVGCRDKDILAHCRGPGPHTKGCWVVDLLLGKE